MYNGRPGKRESASPALPCFKREGKKMMQKNVSMDERDNRDSRNEKLLSAMAYLGILVVVPFFMEKKTQFVRFHLGQGVTLFAAEILYGIIYQLLVVMVLMVSWRLYLIVRIAGYVAFVFPVLALIGIINVLNGQEKELPVIGKIRLFR